ncbi:MAG: hypothetical protein A2571_00525 [Candidatus Vogelbacteria bacterium RIFOXYD1_FULL_44_32]|uniref:Aminoglycoside phosphotransferase domain-containing protein n=1 Tax=Candidatus Vogelbacteria bacterium RIFOXYD1_FULL_44_32 TaxID=1802438 RepID=A0A1G2QE47_9BACT|nr:MAG: hypothetical protein A2571_00525 [Candidatus Vogelbacteria bacterium RIFOXYD1_FULL_44_32]
MNDNLTLENTLAEVLAFFKLGEVRSQVINGRGFVNKTYEVETEKGTVIIQKLANIFDERVTVDSLFLFGWLSARGFVVPEPMIAPSGALSLTLGGYHWRATRYIKHDEAVEKNYATLSSAAMMMGRFHRLMADCRYEPCFTLTGFHDTAGIVGRMYELVTTHRIAGDLAELAEKIKAGASLHLVARTNDRQLIHGDPKFDNFLFVGQRAVALVDFDTLMRGSVLLDLGDSLRSWCRRDGFVFDTRLFEEVVEAYRSEYRPPYTRDEIREAVALITLELCARYVTDAYHQSYFAWDAEKYCSSREHNTARAMDYFRYYQSVVGK